MTKKEKIKEIIFCIAVALAATVLYTIAGAMQRGWVDLPGSATLLVLIAPLTFIWIRFRIADERRMNHDNKSDGGDDHIHHLPDDSDTGQHRQIGGAA